MPRPVRRATTAAPSSARARSAARAPTTRSTRSTPPCPPRPVRSSSPPGRSSTSSRRAMAVDPITITGTNGTTGAALDNKNATALDKDTFLKILVAQLKMQDPTSPTDSSQFMAQMAQFSTVEQLTNMSKTSSDAAASAKVDQSVGLLGRTATYTGSDGLPVSGVVQHVDITKAGPTLTIDGVTGIDPTDLTQVAQGS